MAEQPPKGCPLLAERDIRFVAETVATAAIPLPKHLAGIKKGVVYHHPNGPPFLAAPCKNCDAECPVSSKLTEEVHLSAQSKYEHLITSPGRARKPFAFHCLCVPADNPQ